MMTSDLIKHTHMWVLGACTEWNWYTKQFGDTFGRDFADFVTRTHTLDAKQVFKDHVADHIHG